MSSHRRRQYPKQQFAAYEAQAVSADPGAAAPGYGYAPTAGDAGSVFTPGVATPEAVTDGVSQMALGAEPAPGQYGQYHASQNVVQPAQPVYGNTEPGPAPLNELFNIDLLQSLPPPVNDLDLPPPPLAVPIEASLTHSEFANAGPDYIRSTLNVVPSTNSLLKKSKLPFSVVIRPFNAMREEDESVPVVDDLCIARCRRCRSYIHPFVQFSNQDYRWKCSICGLTNEVPQSFDWDHLNSVTKNRYERPELNYGVVDYIASQEYLVRPPQPPTYVFVIDVSVNAASVALIEQTANNLRDSLDKLPNKDGRTRVAFIAVDGALNYFQIQLPDPSEQASTEPKPVVEPRLLVVSDLEDPFLPSPTGLLMNLQENRPQIEQLLAKLPMLFANTITSSNALGAGLKAALKLIGNVGGKIVCITASLPTVGPGKLEQRDESRAAGNKKNESQLFSPQNSFYKNFAVECNRAQVTVDMFLLANKYQDVASLSNLPKFTAGSTYFMPGFNGMRESDVAKFAHELSTHLSQEIGLEGMLRVRASSGIRSSTFSGHFFVRSSDLMTFPTVPRDQGYVVDMAIDETITKPYITMQGALLYTSALGERRIRVMTLQLPVSDKIGDIYASADQQAIATWYAHQASDKAVSSGISSTQDWLNARIAELLKTYRSDVLNTHAGSSGALSLSSNLTLLPLLLFALKKSIGLRPGAHIPSDIRVKALDLMQSLPLPHLMKYVYPDFYALHELPDEAGLPDENGRVVLPQRLNLTGESLQGHGLYLLDDGQVLFLWIGRDVVPQLLLDAFGTEDPNQIPSGRTELPVVEGSDLNMRVRNLIDATRNRTDSTYYPSLYVIRGDTGEPSMRVWATSLLVEDRTDAEPTYFQYLNTIREKLTA